MVFSLGMWDIEVLRVQILWRNLVRPYFRTLCVEGPVFVIAGASLCTLSFYLLKDHFALYNLHMDIHTFAVRVAMKVSFCFSFSTCFTIYTLVAWPIFSLSKK